MNLISRRNSIHFLFASLSLAAIGPAILSGCAAPQSPSVPLEISPAQAKIEIQNGAMVLDVRQQVEYTAGHIGGAVLIPLDDLASRVQALPKDRLIIVQCRTGGRSAQGRDLLHQQGFANVTSLSGGILAWQAAGYSVEKGEPK
jgi:rhodanese-related sulfurtransferase